MLMPGNLTDWQMVCLDIWNNALSISVFATADSSKPASKAPKTLFNRHLWYSKCICNIQLGFLNGKLNSFSVWWVFKQLIMLVLWNVNSKRLCSKILLIPTHLGFQIIGLNWHLSNAYYLPGSFLGIGHINMNKLNFQPLTCWAEK